MIGGNFTIGLLSNGYKSIITSAMSRFEQLKTAQWNDQNPCFSCKARCCEHAVIPVTAEEHARLFPDYTLIGASAVGDGFVVVKPCPHYVNGVCDAHEESPAACKKYPASPLDVEDGCQFPHDEETIFEWQQEREQLFQDVIAS